MNSSFVYRERVGACCVALLPAIVLLAPAAVADSSKVSLPENYASTFVRYTSVDKPPGDRAAKMRFFYVNPNSLALAEPGKPAPAGTVLIMEDRSIELDAAGNPMLDSAGRFIPTDTITNLFVQEKQDGWGEEYAAGVRNGEWEYAWFLADGSRKPDASMDGCFACHKSAAATDFNFTFNAFVKAMKHTE